MKFIVREIRFLGVIDEMKWRHHINDFRAKITNYGNVVYELLNDEAFYNAMIVLHLTYCIDVWGKAYKTVTNPIFILQKTAV